jgi:EAL domain-containing protein (putative c-di-GMP-specific phosphodiesterase class I)
MHWLHEHGCERAQGYFISPPLAADEFLVGLRGCTGGATQRGTTLRSA